MLDLALDKVVVAPTAEERWEEEYQEEFGTYDWEGGGRGFFTGY